MKYKDDPNWWTHSLLREGYGKDKHWVLLGLPSRDSASSHYDSIPAVSLDNVQVLVREVRGLSKVINVIRRRGWCE